MVSETEILDVARGFAEASEETLPDKESKAERVLRVFKREGKIFLVVHEGTQPLRIEVRCDGKLGKLLRERYESVMLSKTLGGSGIEVICSGQLEADEVIDLVRLSWGLSVPEAKI